MAVMVVTVVGFITYPTSCLAVALLAAIILELQVQEAPWEEQTLQQARMELPASVVESGREAALGK
jgi:hypothetical protein